MKTFLSQNLTRPLASGTSDAGEDEEARGGIEDGADSEDDVAAMIPNVLAAPIG